MINLALHFSINKFNMPVSLSSKITSDAFIRYPLHDFSAVG